METFSPTGLMVDLLSVPEESFVSHASPRFSWIVNDPTDGVSQTAYQVLISSDETLLAQDNGDVWDSGKIHSNQSVSVACPGLRLEPEQTFFWKVRSWNNNDEPSPFSPPQRFLTSNFAAERKWPGESRLVETTGHPPEARFEDRHAVRYCELPPAKVRQTRSGHYFIAFEKGAFGTLKIQCEPKDFPQPVTVHLGEKATDNEKVDRMPGGSIGYKCVTTEIPAQTSVFIVPLPRQISSYPNSQVLPDSMPEVTPFRFAEIENFPGKLTSENVRQLALLYRFDDHASSFSCSDTNLNKVWNLCKHTLKTTPFFGLYLDGARERMPYEADAYIQEISHYCVDREYAIGRATMQFLIYNPAWPTEWHLHMVLMAWADYMETGNPQFLERNYNELKAKTLLALAREDGLISTRTGLVTEAFLKSLHYQGNNFRDIVDWPQGTPANEETNRSGHGSDRIEGETDRFVYSNFNTVVNAFHFRNLVLMGRIAAIVGKPEDAKEYKERAAAFHESFNRAFLDPDTGIYLDGEGVGHSSLHANMFPVTFGLAPAENHASILEFIRSRGMACSPYGAPYLLDALFLLGDESHALDLLTSDSDRSWLNMLRIGSTITTEAWDMKFKKNMTWNHAWGASPVYTLTRKIMGIKALKPGYQKVLIKPRPGRLQHAEITSPTIRGPITAAFQNTPGADFSLSVEIPPNTTAEVHLPRRKATAAVTKNDAPIDPFVQDDSFVIERVDAGKHRFVVRS